ncbi:hypothetical protein NLJ89_g1260 [Agrocybe chaxingu]|uniref:Gfo/Idh/MocA-like oxidoreductase N-terminal domain-containing protein n=1 Tax=Agrocybe chaxingu TaxID=84603 RepID=A0A9W8TDM1_9AGAR|nr:hypothetical protein NLJ89_g1260 [Agrocybe chaxingu]
MSSSAPIKVGFVGLSASGWAAQILGPSITDPSLHSKYDLVAISTTSAASAQTSAQKYAEKVGHPVKAYHGDVSQIANDPDVNFVAVSVKAPSHKELVLPAIEAGKDFFLEWPAGTSSKETEEIAEAAKRRGVKSLIGLQGRHSRAVLKVRELIAAGAIGTVRSTHIVSHVGREISIWPPLVFEKLTYLTKKENGANKLTIPLGHQLDTLTHLLGDFTSVSALIETLFPTGTYIDETGKPTGKTFPSETPDHFSISGVLSSGIVANVFLRSGYASGPGRRQFLWEIDGEEGSIRLESDHQQAATPGIIEPKLFLNGKPVEVEGAEKAGALDSATTAWKEFADGHGHYATIEDALKHKRLLDAIETSAREGKKVFL